MQQHGREKETSAWLAHEYGGKEGNNLFIVRAGSPETAELTWSKVQRRIAQLIREDQFFTEQEKSVLEQEPNYGDYPDEKAQAQMSTLKETGMEAPEPPTPEPVSYTHLAYTALRRVCSRYFRSMLVVHRLYRPARADAADHEAVHRFSQKPLGAGGCGTPAYPKTAG